MRRNKVRKQKVIMKGCLAGFIIIDPITAGGMPEKSCNRKLLKPSRRFPRVTTRRTRLSKLPRRAGQKCPARLLHAKTVYGHYAGVTIRTGVPVFCAYSTVIAVPPGRPS